MQSLFDLSGKVAVITGSTLGIGRAIAERMAEAGACVTVSSRKADACDPAVIASCDSLQLRSLKANKMPECFAPDYNDFFTTC